MGLGQNPHTLHLRHHERAWAGTKEQEADVNTDFMLSLHLAR